MNDDLRIKIWNNFKGECQDCGQELTPYPTLESWFKKLSLLKEHQEPHGRIALLLRPNIHHLDENKSNEDETNLILLCNVCHMRIHHSGHRDHDRK